MLFALFRSRIFTVVQPIARCNLDTPSRLLHPIPETGLRSTQESFFLDEFAREVAGAALTPCGLGARQVKTKREVETSIARRRAQNLIWR